MRSVEWVGWVSSVILLLTVGRQIQKQWQEKTSKGVSKWLFLGQVAAEIGFIIYSWALENWVFAVTNAVLLIENFVGLGLVMHHRRRENRIANANPHLPRPPRSP